MRDAPSGRCAARMAAVLVATLTMAVVLVACGSAGSPAGGPARPPSAPPTPSASASRAASGAAAMLATTAASAIASMADASPTPDPGLLPQTRTEPTTTSAAFTRGIGDLWAAVVADQPATALPFFFPLSAYLQVKAIAAPAADWRDRLVGFYDLDIARIHTALGPDARSARLLGVSVPSAQAGWVNPGVEYNKIGYWRVYGTQVRYELDGRQRSFGVCSLISWRGEWYAVHLGPISGRSPGVGALCLS